MVEYSMAKTCGHRDLIPSEVVISGSIPAGNLNYFHETCGGRVPLENVPRETRIQAEGVAAEKEFMANRNNQAGRPQTTRQ